ncbi:DUF2905 domain-containing protein [Pedomonas mirosovicensis]|uniref:DUF2905 domain-containing protein n=1 Tax=Pedomonas mirosovicensis TaxID=2908641 RepID=UPI0021670DD9|nr:DUF2905 domain-containing protein [Pedomonas mirosovicensis]MCH8684345.1 DUF2905 domain-containing protein [Pedomonas mirosovicensis]
MGRFLIIAGIVMLALGLAWPLISKLGLGRLPGDIVWERGNTRVYFPIVTSIILSVALSLILYLIGRGRG